MPSFRFVQCDVFSDRPFSGNALAVFTNAGGLDDRTMAAIARETNLSETVFVLPSQAGGDFRARIFTPGSELPFAGHPLIGTAVVLGRALPLDRLVLETGVGHIALHLEREAGEISRAVMEQPEPRFSMHPAADALCAALRLEPRPVPVGDNGVRTALIPLTGEERIGELSPDLTAVSAIEGLDTVSVFADEGDVVRARVFAPWVGVPEDPGTGSAAGTLAAHLGRPVTILQGVEIGRPSTIDVVAGDGRPPRVGGAVTLVARGTYVL
ncbi:MAG: trans-2,3-dihydro-3-hydroxyanthranilate isomerase [Gaiellales bacterium]|nr:trans-2,3-dihydro-3-hydroxyanthranilate isomerase [Gaiellales bacterium]